MSDETEETEETTGHYPPNPVDSPPPAGDKPNIAIGKLVYRNYYVRGEPAVIGNMHNILDERLDSRHVLMDLITRAGVEDGDEFLISVQRIGPKFPDEKWSIGEGGRLEKSVPLNANAKPGGGELAIF